MSERDLLLDEFQKRDALQAANEEARKNDGVRTQAQAKLERDLQAKMREQGVRLSRSETRDLLRQAAQRSAEDAGATAVGKDSKRGVSTPKEFEDVKRRKTKVDVLPGFVAQKPEAGEPPIEGGEWRQVTDCDGNTFEVLTRNFTPA